MFWSIDGKDKAEEVIESMGRHTSSAFSTGGGSCLSLFCMYVCKIGQNFSFVIIGGSQKLLLLQLMRV